MTLRNGWNGEAGWAGGRSANAAGV
jgi:hypothetical protein